LAGDGIAKTGRDLRERFQYEPPFAESRVRDDETRFIDHRLPEKNQIEVERPRRVAMRTLAPAFLLDGHQGVEQLSRAQRRVADHRGVEKGRLRPNDADRFGFVIARDSEMREQRRQPGNRVIEVGAPIADVAAERDGGCYSIHRDGSTSP